MEQQAFKQSLTIADLPKNTKRRVVWRTDGAGGTAIMLVGYCPDTLEFFLALAKDLKERIPDANIDEATCSKVIASPYIKGYTVLLAPIPGPKRRIPGFEEYSRIDFNC